MKFATCKYQGWDREYDFLIEDDADYKAGDRAVVHTGTYEVVEIVNVQPAIKLHPSIDYKYLVQKVDCAEYDRLTEEYQASLKEKPSANRL